MSDLPVTPPDYGGRPQSLGSILRTSRERKGLELDDVAEVTHVRKEYLRALEEGRYSDLPEDVYARNFLRLFAQAVGLDGAKLLDMFARERAGGIRAGGQATGQTTGPTARAAGAGRETPVTGRLEPRPESERRRAPAQQASRPPGPRTSNAAGTAGSSAAAAQAAAAPTDPSRRQRAREAQPPTVAGAGGSGRRMSFPRVRFGSLLATVLLVAAIVAVALWAFNNQLFDATSTAPPIASAPPPASTPLGEGVAVPLPDAGEPLPGEAPGAGAADGTPEATEQARDVLLTVESEPAGAEVTVDGFPLPGTTPIGDVPVTARASRTVRVTLDGYQPFEATYDLSFDRTVSVILEPEAPAAVAPAVAGETPDGAPPQPAGAGQIALDVTEPTWLEVYAGTARGQGSRLVYTTAQPGDRFMFDLPVYVHVGNAAGLHVSVNGQDLGNFGSPGAVIGRAFTP